MVYSDIVEHPVIKVAIAGGAVRRFYPTHSIATDTIAEVRRDAVGIPIVCAIHTEIAIGILLLERTLIHESETLELVLHRRAERSAVVVDARSKRRSSRIQRRRIAIGKRIRELRIEIAGVKLALKFRLERRLRHLLAQSIPVHVSEEWMRHQLLRVASRA